MSYFPTPAPPFGPGDPLEVSLGGTGLMTTGAAGRIPQSNGADTYVLTAPNSLGITSAGVSGLGTLATQNGTFSGTSSGTNTGDQDLTNYFLKTADDTDDVTVGATNKFATAAEKTKVGFIAVTQAVDLDVIESDTVTNNAKVTNATHTGQVTGSGALTVDKTAISDQSSVVAAADDVVLIGDTSDSSNLKKVTVQSIVDLATGPFFVTGTLVASSSQTIATGKYCIYSGKYEITGSFNLTIEGTSRLVII